jgi:hypothetical protein
MGALGPGQPLNGFLLVACFGMRQTTPPGRGEVAGDGSRRIVSAAFGMFYFGLPNRSMRKRGAGGTNVHFVTYRSVSERLVIGS